MVHSKKAELEVKIEVDMPVDIIDDKDRLKAVETVFLKVYTNKVYHSRLIKLISKSNSIYSD